MPALVLSQSEVRTLLPMATCMDLMADALKTLSRGEAVNPLRRGILLPNNEGLLGTMPGYIEPTKTLGLKVVAVKPTNHGTRYDSHQGVVMLFEPAYGLPVAIVDASEITAIRTAAVTGVATRALAREDAAVLAILGSGVQARTHVAAMLVARNIKQVRVFSPSADHRETFARDSAAHHGVPVEACDSAQAAVAGADIICTTTSAREPILEGGWIARGAHINAVGSSVSSTRELDTRAVRESRLYVDRMESALNEAGDILEPLKEGAITENHIVGEVGDVLMGKAPGRRSPDETTLFKSLGLAVEDLAAADYVYRQAREAGIGTEVQLGGVVDAGH